jgi:N-acetylmuramoyl-L-alanine amidase/Secretion system C-terminal sorting domain
MKSIYTLCLFVFALSTHAQIKKGENNYATIDFAHLPKDTKVSKQISTTVFDLPIQQLSFDAPTPFISFSCRWEEKNFLPNNTNIFIRFSKDNNTWTAWDEMKKDIHNNDGTNKNYAQLIYIDKAIKFYQIKVKTDLENKGSVIKNLFLNFFNPGKIIRTVSTENETTNRGSSPTETLACPCPIPTYVTRAQWNCPQGQGLAPGVGVSNTLTHIIVHHSDGPNTSTDWNAVVLSIWNYHKNTNGWSDIGYNWLVAPNGVLYEGRGSSNVAGFTTGAHFCGFNAATMGVCMIGTYMTTSVTTAARNTLIDIAAWRCCNVGLDPTISSFHASSGFTLNNISGHQNGCATDCPGTTFYNTLPTLRTEVAAKINSCNAPPPPCIASVTNSVVGCPSSNITFTPTNVTNGGTAPTFAWYKNNVLVQTSATYNLNPAANGDKVFCRMTSNAACATTPQVNSDTITISCIVSPPICVASVTNSIAGCPSSNVIFTPTNVTNGGTAPAFAWYKNNVLVQTSATYNLNPAANGDKVFCRMTSNAACATTAQVNSDTITLSCINTVTPPTITEEYIKISPNPSNGNFIVKMKLNQRKLISYKLRSADGKIVLQTSKENVSGLIEKPFFYSKLASGLYVLEIIQDNIRTTHKILIKK